MTDLNTDDRTAICRLTRSVRRLIEAVQRDNSETWQLARQASIDLSVVEHRLGGYCADIPEGKSDGAG